MNVYKSKWILSKAYENLFELLSDDSIFDCRTVYEHYVLNKGIANKNKVTIVLRVDVDNGLHLTEPLVKYLNSFGLKATHYFLTHPKRYYNIWESYIPKLTHDLGHEVGLHTDHYYEQLEYGENALENLKKDINRLSALIGEPIKGMVYHGHVGMNRKNVTNWELTKNIESKELGLEYHDGLKSCYIEPSSLTWKPKCDFRISDFMGISNSWGWNYYPEYPIIQIKKHAKKGKVIHIAFHTKNAFSNYWEAWNNDFNETYFPKENIILFYKKKFLIKYKPLIVNILRKVKLLGLIKYLKTKIINKEY